MKKMILFFGLCIMLLNAKAQNAKPEFLKEPASWEFERFPLPPVFSTNFPYSGVEELRFSPGMFNKDSSNYFCYAFVALLDNTTSFTQQQVKDYLLGYFKGLCGYTATQRKLSIDTSQIAVSIDKKSNSGHATIYNSVLKIFGVFADGAPVTLNAEIKVLNNSEAKKTYMVFIASPHEKTDSIWQQLYAIRESFTMP